MPVEYPSSVCNISGYYCGSPYNYNYMPYACLSSVPHSSQTPPLPSMTGKQSTFKLWFISGNISKCAGCNNKYDKPPIPPYNLCVQHKEWRRFTLAAGRELQSKFAPAYYHLSVICIRKNWPLFEAYEFIISDDIKSKMTQQHWNFLKSQGFSSNTMTNYFNKCKMVFISIATLLFGVLSLATC